jgi:hypothetical protein
MKCPFCQDDAHDDALVCHSCGRDIVVPPQLLIERDELRKTRNDLVARLEKAQTELAQLRGLRNMARRVTRRRDVLT